MAKIQSITFNRFGKNEGCTCSKCGKYITNVFTVKLTTGEYLNYGTTCFPKLQKEGISKSFAKKFKKSIELYQFWLDKLVSYNSGELNEENDTSYLTHQEDWDKDSYWHGKSYEEYKTWMVEEFIPFRLKMHLMEINKFANILEV